ncbi:hypothetical protein WJX75_004114 [Coccomyxa subellipsoidea]|uniref:Uncharacterized protein n=1 Tax=Coccomyxa subellipsoidea TaxID=248742 RepID=A0ABR2YC40_9CHLO
MVGVGLEKPPAERAAGLADSALALVPAAAAPGSKPVAAMSAEAATAGGGIESLRTVHFQQQAQSSATVDNAANGAAGAPPLSARRRGLAAWGDNVAEVKDETWVREGWHGGAKSGAAKAGTARRGTGGLGRRAKVGLGTGRGRLEPLTADAADDDEEALRALPRGRSLPLVAQSGAAIKGGSRKAPHRKMRPNKPFQPKNKDYLTDALAAIVEASLDTDKSRRQGLQETKNTAVDIVERVTGYKQVPRDPKDVDRDGSLGDTKASKPAQRQEGKAEASGQGEATALGRQESAGELEGYVSQQAAIRLFSSDPKALERLKSHRVLAKIKQTLRDMGIPAADVAVLPKGKENKGWSGGSDAAEKQKLKTKRWLLAAGNVSEEPQKPLPSRLVAAIQAAAGFVHLTLPSEGQAHSFVTTE